jgi:very-short-patch-repair endonuclease
MEKCLKCGKEFLTKRKLGSHQVVHTEGWLEKNRTRKGTGHRVEKKSTHICIFCSREFSSGLSLGGHTSGCKLNPNRKVYTPPKIKRVMTEENKKKVSLGMKKAHREGRAWNIGQSRWNHTPSYPEKFFMKVIKNEFTDKKYVYEYPISIYSIDFAWPSKKKAIEIDGKQHKIEEYKNRDLRKDECVKKFGWKILRISWENMCNNTKDNIRLAEDFIDNQ